MAPIRLVSTCLLCGMLAACSSLSVQWDYDPHVDFPAYRTFDWMPREQEPSGDEPGLPSPFTGRRIKRAALEALIDKGFERSIDDPDFLVAYYVTYQTTETVDVYDRGYYRPPYAGHVRSRTEGTIVLDFVDARTRELIWRGWGTRRVRSSASPDKRQEEIDLIVGAIVSKFPPY